MQTPTGLNPEPSGREETVLTTAPLCQLQTNPLVHYFTSVLGEQLPPAAV